MRHLAGCPLGWALLCAALTWFSCDTNNGATDGDGDGDADGDADADGLECPEVPGTVLDGWPCCAIGDCTEGAACEPEDISGAAGGRCVRSCETPGTECSEGAACWEEIGSWCTPTCSTRADCPIGRACGENGYCIPICQDDSECRSGHCNRYTTECTDGTPPEGLDVMERCDRNEECRSGLCSTYCVTLCIFYRAGCPGDFVCTTETEAEVGICAPRCDDNSDCDDPGLECYGVCWPRDGF